MSTQYFILVKGTVKNSRDKINVIVNRELEAMSFGTQAIFVVLLRRKELAIRTCSSL